MFDVQREKRVASARRSGGGATRLTTEASLTVTPYHGLHLTTKVFFGPLRVNGSRAYFLSHPVVRKPLGKCDQDTRIGSLTEETCLSSKRGPDRIS